MSINKGPRFFIIAVFLLACVIFKEGQIMTTVTDEGKPQAVISLGEDLTAQEKETVMKFFEDWQKGKDIRFVSVSNDEERFYLEGIVDEKLIGSKAISSAYCEQLAEGKGIEVKTENITAVTPFMYANALVTAGVEDARVIAAAPFEVSGTAALTGIIKAFETISGEELNENAKQTANEEMAETSQLGNRIGRDKAEKVIYEVKRQVIDQNVSHPDEIKKIILQVSADFSVNLSDEDVARITDLMVKIQKLNLSAGQLGSQIENITRKLDEIQNTGQETVGLLQKLMTMLQELLASIRSLVGA